MTIGPLSKHQARINLIQLEILSLFRSDRAFLRSFKNGLRIPLRRVPKSKIQFAFWLAEFQSTGNLTVNLVWSALLYNVRRGVCTDRFGPRRTFQIFTLGSIPLYCALPFLVHSVRGSLGNQDVMVISTSLALSQRFESDPPAFLVTHSWRLS